MTTERDVRANDWIDEGVYGRPAEGMVRGVTKSQQDGAAVRRNSDLAPGTSAGEQRRFDADPQRVRDAREYVADLLVARGWSAPAVEKAQLVISELATNAILHAQTPFELTCHIGGRARFEIRDWDPSSVPLVADAKPGRVGGLGLRLIEAIATEWGVETHPEFKVVWCTVEDGDWPRVTPEGPRSSA